MARKSWKDLSPAYRKRLHAAGITPSRHAAGENLSRARGHAHTPEHPNDVLRMPPAKRQTYQGYIQERSTDIRQVIARKERIWGNRPKFKATRSAQAVQQRMLSAGHVPKLSYMRRFLRMSVEEIEALMWWTDPEWHFLFYH